MAQGNDTRENDNMAQGSNELQRPNRKEFQRVVIIANNGSLVDPQDWQNVLGNAVGGARKKILRENGWSETKVFDQQAYDDARRDFREHSRNQTQTMRKNLFTRIFDEAAVDHHPRLESALRTVLPIIDDRNERRMMKALTGMLIALEPAIKKNNGADDADDDQGGRGRTNGNGNQKNAGGSEPGGNSKNHPGAETTEDGRRINKDGSIDKRTKPEGGISEATAKARGMDVGDEDGQSNGGRQAKSQDDRGSRNDGGDHSGTDGVRSKEKEDENGNFVKKADREAQGNGNQNRTEGRQGGKKHDEQRELELLGQIKGQYDEAVEEAMNYQDLAQLDELRKLYDVAVDRVRNGEEVSDMFEGQNRRGNRGGQQATGGSNQRETEGSQPGGNSMKHPGAETDAEGHRLNQDGSVDKRTKGDNEEESQSQQTRREHGLQGTTKEQEGMDDGRQQAKSQDRNDDNNDHSGTDGVRSKEKEDENGNFVPKAQRDNGGNGARA